MSNSSLATYTKLSPNCNHPRSKPIDEISIHCMAGKMTSRSCAEWLSQSTTKASANYCIGYDGDISVSVNECDRSWCTSSGAVDNRAVTIEVSSSSTHPYEVTAAAYASLIALCADICKRNNIKKLLWEGDKNLLHNVARQNLVPHRWLANKACPGEYLYSRFGDIAEQVNQILNNKGDVLEDMTTQELTETINKAIAAAKPATYKFIEDIPAYARPSVQKAMDEKILSGTGTENGKAVLNLEADFLRTIVILDRLGLFNSEDACNCKCDSKAPIDSIPSTPAAKPSMAEVLAEAKKVGK